MPSLVRLHFLLPVLAAFGLGLWLQLHGAAESRAVAEKRVSEQIVASQVARNPLRLEPDDVEQLLTADSGARRDVLIDLLPRASASDLKDIAAWLPVSEEASWEVLLLRWNEAAPRDMAVFLQSHGELRFRETGLALMAESMPELLAATGPDTDAAEANLKALLAANVPRALEEWWRAKGKARMWPEPDHFRSMGHEAFIAWTISHTDVEPKDILKWRTEVFADWVAVNASAAMTYASGLTGELRKSAVSAVMEALAVKDPVKALAWMKSLPEESRDGSAQARLFQELARKDLDAALAGIRETWPDESSRKAMAGRLLSALAEDGNPAALRVLQELPWNASDVGNANKVFGPGSDALKTLFKTWAQRDPEAAFAGLKSVPARLQDPVFVSAVFDGWAIKSPEDAMAAIPRLLAGDAAQQKAQRDSVLYTWAENDIEGALRCIAGTRDATVRNQDEVIICDVLLNSSFMAIWKHLPNLTVNAVGSQAEDMAYYLASDQPSFTAREFPNAPADWVPVVQCGAWRAQVATDSQQAPAVAAQLTQNAAKLDAEWAGRCVAEVAKSWVANDSTAAAAWVNSWPDAMKAHAIDGLLEGLTKQDNYDPGEIFAWAAAMTPANDWMEQKQNSRLSDSFNQLIHQDAAAAQAILEASNIREDWKAEFLSRLDPQSPPP